MADADEEFEARQVVIVHKGLWEDLDRWGQARGLMLVRIPSGTDDDGNLTMDPGDDLPPYAFIPRDIGP
jgi:hypothetical protein